MHGLRALFSLLLTLGAAARPLLAQRPVAPADVRLLASDISVRSWTVESGLPQSSVIELAVDRDGYAWGGTFGGLFRFDGRSIQTYASSELPVLSANAVTALYAHPNGDLWVGTPTGTIARLRNGQVVDTVVALPHDQATSTIDALTVDRAGALWVREGGEVHHFVRGRWSAPLPYSSHSSMVQDAQGRLYYVGPQGLVQVNANGESRVVRIPNTPELRGPAGLYLDTRERLWFGQQAGLWVQDAGKIRRIPGIAGRVQVIAADDSGTVWIGAGARLYRYRPPANGNEGVPPQAILDAGGEVHTLAFTRDGLLLLGTSERLVVVRPRAARLISAKRAFSDGGTNSLASPGDGTVFSTSACSDVRRTDSRSTVVDLVARPLTPGCSQSLLVDRQRRLWIGGDGAIRRRNVDGTDRVWRINSYLPSPATVRPLLEHGDTVLFGLSDGRVGRIGADNVLTLLPGWETPTDAPIHSMGRSGDGTVWIAQTGMLARWRDGTQRTFHQLHGIPLAIPRAVLPDTAGGVWIGTYGSGLWYFREGSRARRVALPDPTISALITDQNHRMWIPGNRGLTVVSLAALRRWVADSTEPPVSRLLSIADGVPEANAGWPAATQLSPGVLAFATIRGMVEVRTSLLKTAGETPVVRIDSLRSGTGRIFDPAEPIVLTPEDRVLNVGFSAPTFRFADAIQYRYRLEGRDNTWSSLGTSRTMRISSLNPGRYTLRLEGRVPGGNWRDVPPLEISVPARLIELRWPRVLLVLSVVTLIVLALLQRVRSVKATAQAREVELQARRDAAVAAEAHQREMAQVGRVAVAGELTASLSHELGQPLAAIVNNAEVARRLVARQVAQGGVANPAVEEALLDVVAQGRRASQVVREFRRFLRREQGEREELTVRDLLDSTTVLLRQEFADRGVPLHVEVARGVPAVQVERVLIQQVLVNLLQNALEAARWVPAGQVLLRARPMRGGVRMTVVDNGSGFAADVRRSAFEPFVTTRANGMGMGLAIARRVVEAHGGSIAVGQLPSAGAVVSLWLPARHVPVDGSDSLVPQQVTMHG
jgi:signal transduction histidine kinase/ligand-binding sensor domain-containing protein